MMDEFTLVRHATLLRSAAAGLVDKAWWCGRHPVTENADAMAMAARVMHEALAAYFADVAPVPVDPADERAARAMGEPTE